MTMIEFFLSLSGEQILSSSTKLSATCNIVGAEMRYTTDGTMPTMESPIFKPFTVKSAMTVTVGAFLDGERVLTTQGKYWFGEVATPEIAVNGDLTFIGNQARMVSISCGTEDAVVHYTLHGGEPTEEDSPTYTGPFVINLAADETVAIRARAFKANCKPSEIAETSITREWALGDGVNAPGLAFMTGGAAEWARDTSTGHVDGESLRSGALSDEQATWLETKVNGKGTIQFWWKTSCEETDDEECPWDRVEFSVDGVRVAWQDGELSEWQKIEHSITESGEHILRWTYIKDISDSCGDDCAWLDGVSWVRMSADPIPEVHDDSEVLTALTGSADSGLAANITNVAVYSAYREWAQFVKSVDGMSVAGKQAVKDSTRAWLSFALGADALIGRELSSDDIKIESFAPESTDGKFEFVVSVRDVNIGGGVVDETTLKANLKKVLGVEGSATLSPNAFSPDNIEITFDAPVDGKARFTVSPPVDAGNSFFMRVKVK